MIYLKAIKMLSNHNHVKYNLNRIRIKEKFKLYILNSFEHPYLQSIYGHCSHFFLSVVTKNLEHTTIYIN